MIFVVHIHPCLGNLHACCCRYISVDKGKAFIHTTGLDRLITGIAEYFLYIIGNRFPIGILEWKFIKLICPVIVGVQDTLSVGRNVIDQKHDFNIKRTDPVTVMSVIPGFRHRNVGGSFGISILNEIFIFVITIRFDHLSVIRNRFFLDNKLNLRTIRVVFRQICEFPIPAVPLCGQCLSIDVRIVHRCQIDGNALWTVLQGSIVPRP